MSGHREINEKLAERAKARQKRRSSEGSQNVQYVKRVSKVNGTEYTEGMSDAYWRGVQDGESTAARMVRRADPKNVRVRSLAVISDEPQEQGVALPENEDNQLAAAPTAAVAVAAERETSAAVITVSAGAALAEREQRESTAAVAAETPVIGLGRHETYSENGADTMNMNKTGRQQPAPVRPTPVIIEASDSSQGNTYSRNDGISSERETGNASFAQRVRDRVTGADRAGVAAEGADGAQPALSVQRWKEISFLRRIIMILSGVLFIYALLPLVLGIFNIGIIPLALIAWFFFTVALLWNHIENCRSRILNAVFAVIAGIVVLGIVGMAFISGKMIGASLKTLPEDQTDVTVVVLGCLVIDDKPSLMLERRLETAAEYLLSNPNAYCVVTGGQGENEDYPEAVIMKNYLVEAGVSPGRIIVEQKSTSTVENLQFAADLIEKYNCHEDVVIVSDRFHQYRAGLAAEEAGLNSYAMPCDTAWYLVAHYWFREMAGIAQIWLNG